MSKDKRKPTEMTTQELAEKMFGKKLKKKLDKIAHEGEESENNNNSESSHE